MHLVRINSDPTLFAFRVEAADMYSVFFLPGENLIFLGAHNLPWNHNRKMNTLSLPHAILKH